ncbi:MAG: cofactor-independent phosphoglycerate mutase [Desulfobulbaceae bacterium]|jgi:2,3-bisphosphoglycerate-independent phosphoglycerate mutase|nr:cofactor-independent phosphoglycerate mutase [Desulfobulbaceae bacterium]
MSVKYLILVGDGMGDYPLAELAGRTPLEAARTPVIDALCGAGELFFAKTVPDGYPPGSDVANMSLMGYDPARYYTGRAPLEAAAMGVPLAADEIAFRCNLVTLDYDLATGRATMLDFAAGHIGNAESHQLIAALQAECGSTMFHFYPGVSYRHLLVLTGEHPGFAPAPPHDHSGKDVSAYFREYLRHSAWRDLMTKVGATLAAHPVNQARREAGKKPATMIWPWGEGKAPAMPSLVARFSISGAMVSAVDLLKGLGVVGGLAVADVPGATGYIDTNYAGKAQAAIDALKSQDLAFVHLEGPDEAGHQGLLADKIQAIEDFDGRIVAPIVAALREQGEEFRAIITMDHFTPMAIRTHSRDAVPVLLYDSRRNTGLGLPFHENACAEAARRMGAETVVGHKLLARLLERNEV